MVLVSSLGVKFNLCVLCWDVNKFKKIDCKKTRFIDFSKVFKGPNLLARIISFKKFKEKDFHLILLV